MSEQQEAGEGVDLGEIGDMGDVAANVGASDVWDDLDQGERGVAPVLVVER